MDLNSRVEARVVADVDEQMYGLRYEWTEEAMTEICKGASFCKTVGGIMVLVLFALSDNALYLYQILSKYFPGFTVTDLNSRVDARVVANVDKWKYSGGTDGRTNR